MCAVPKMLLYFLCFQKELWELYIVIASSVRQSVGPLRVRCISPIFIEVGIPILVCGCIFGWQSVMYYFRVTVTLTSALVFRISVSRTYVLYH